MISISIISVIRRFYLGLGGRLKVKVRQEVINNNMSSQLSDFDYLLRE